MGIFFSCKKKLKKERKRNSIKNGNKPLPSKNKFSTKTKKFVHFPPAI